MLSSWIPWQFPLGLITIFLKNRRKGTAIAGLILEVVSLIVAGMVTAAVSAGMKAVDDSSNDSPEAQAILIPDTALHSAR